MTCTYYFNGHFPSKPRLASCPLILNLQAYHITQKVLKFVAHFSEINKLRLL